MCSTLHAMVNFHHKVKFCNHAFDSKNTPCALACHQKRLIGWKEYAQTCLWLNFPKHNTSSSSTRCQNDIDPTPSVNPTDNILLGHAHELAIVRLGDTSYGRKYTHGNQNGPKNVPKRPSENAPARPPSLMFLKYA